MFNWFWKRIFSAERIASIMDKVRPYVMDSINVNVKDLIFNALEDEEIGLAVTTYGDLLFDRYKKKVWGTIGGLQKGVNASLAPEQSLSFMDAEGNISLSNIFKMAMGGQLQGLLSGGQSPSSSQPSSRRREITSQ